MAFVVGLFDVIVDVTGNGKFRNLITVFKVSKIISANVPDELLVQGIFSSTEFKKVEAHSRVQHKIMF